MGQAIVDLPDPLQSSSSDPSEESALSAASLASADDLLSQLAGDDIDRLLAEADAEPKPVVFRPAPQATAQAIQEAAPPAASIVATPPQASPATAEPSVLKPPVDSSDEATLSALLADLNEPPAASVIDQLPATPPQAASLSVTDRMKASDLSELDRLLSAEAAAQIDAATPALPGVEGKQASNIDAVVANSTNLSDGDIAGDLVAAVERQALTGATAMVQDESLAAISEQAKEFDHSIELKLPETDQGRPSLIVRILELINAPMLMCSNELREAFGKVALLTLFNSTAVLIYVLLFRKHPHQ